LPIADCRFAIVGRGPSDIALCFFSSLITCHSSLFLSSGHRIILDFRFWILDWHNPRLLISLVTLHFSLFLCVGDKKFLMQKEIQPLPAISLWIIRNCPRLTTPGGTMWL
jgi:hypothetical protein